MDSLLCWQITLVISLQMNTPSSIYFHLQSTCSRSLEMHSQEPVRQGHCTMSVSSVLVEKSLCWSCHQLPPGKTNTHEAKAQQRENTTSKNISYENWYCCKLCKAPKCRTIKAVAGRKTTSIIFYKCQNQSSEFSASCSISWIQLLVSPPQSETFVCFLSRLQFSLRTAQIWHLTSNLYWRQEEPL